MLQERVAPDGRRWFSIAFGISRLIAFAEEEFIPDRDRPSLIGEFIAYLEENTFMVQHAAKRRQRRRERRIASQPIRPSAPYRAETRDFAKSAPPDQAPPPDRNDRDELKPVGRYEPRAAAPAQAAALPHPSPGSSPPSRKTRKPSANAPKAAAAREVLERLGTADLDLDDRLDDIAP